MTDLSDAGQYRVCICTALSLAFEVSPKESSRVVVPFSPGSIL